MPTPAIIDCDPGHDVPSEYNIMTDLEAAAIVLGTGVPITHCGLNVTFQALVTPEVLARRDDRRSSAVSCWRTSTPPTACRRAYASRPTRTRASCGTWPRSA